MEKKVAKKKAIKKKVNTSTGITTIYSISQSSTVIYIGSTDREVDMRWEEHKKALSKGKHTNKSLQKAYDSDSNFTYAVVLQIPTDNTLIKFFVESLVNSIYKPRCNKCIVSQGRMRVILQRCNGDLAKAILKTIEEFYNQ